MGLFSFLKGSGSKAMAEAAAKNEAKAKSEEAAKERLEGLLEGVLYSANVGIKNIDVEIENDVVKVFGEAGTQSAREKAILILGNMEGVAAIDDRISVVNPEPAKPESQMYEVQGGDSLSKIAKQFYGDPMKYSVIFEANQPMLKDPNIIHVGQTLRIPTV
ncbi:peptidoglycan-binding protein LysM [Saprospiraceae bacterium]|nr:peptidoglycan-binding protein LysM [Saprospiraceae bacterium]